MNNRIIAFLLAMCMVVGVTAQNIERLSEYEQDLYGNSAYITGDYDTMKNLRRYWTQEALKLKVIRGCEFTLTGNAESVLRITVPARLLYGQNDTILTPYAENSLRPLLRYVRGEMTYASVIVSCHSDNNGSERFLNSQTQSRANALAQWFMRQGVSAGEVSSYGLGDRVPKFKNDNIAHRERNRRVDIYLVPNKKMLKLAKKGKLEIVD